MDAGAEGLEFARSRLDGSIDSVLVHASPERIRVEVSDNGAELVASGDDLHDDAAERTPMTRLWVDGLRVLRRDVWPQQDDLGTVVILAGGEAGVLRAWSTDDDRTRWRWQVGFEGGA